MAWIGLVLAAPSLGGLASRNVSLRPDLTTRQLAVLLHDESRDPKPGTTLAIPALDFSGREVTFRSGKLLSIFVGHCDTCSAVRIEDELKTAPLNANVLVVSNGTEKQMQELSKKLPGSARLV